MNYYLDTEFLEGTQKTRYWSNPLVILGHTFMWLGIILIQFFPEYSDYLTWLVVFPGLLTIVLIPAPQKNTKPTIDLISIGVVADDGREYYAISKDFNLKEAWNRWQIKDTEPDALSHGKHKEYWIRKNVLKPIFDEFYPDNLSNLHFCPDFTYKNMKKVIKFSGKSNEQIAREVREFVSNDPEWTEVGSKILREPTDEPPEFYGYYADYDWVVFCWLFGKMDDLPKGFPKYCRDLKQMLDEKDNPHLVMQYDGADHQMKIIEDLGHNWKVEVSNPGNSTQKIGNKFEIDKAYVKTIVNGDWRTHPRYPEQTNEHSAIHDARWNQKLHQFIKTL